MKKNTIVVPVLALSLLAGGLFMAPHSKAMENHGAKHMQQQSTAHFTEAQRAKAHALIETSREKMRPVREAMYVKKQELKALQGATNPDVVAVSRTAKEMTELRSQMHSEKQALNSALDKALGLPAGTHAMKKYQFGKNGVAFGHGNKNHGRKGGRHMNQGHFDNKHGMMQ